MTRIAIVGDIHGDVHRLRRALAHLKGLAVKIIFVGDYVDRGPFSREVLEELAALSETYGDQIVLLRGNHDDALLEYLKTGQRGRFIAQGGLTTVRSYLVDVPRVEPLAYFRSTFPRRHLSLLENTQIYYEESDLLVSHCGYNPAEPESRSREDLVNGTFPAVFNENSSVGQPGKLHVFGHYVQVNHLPYQSKRVICVDTGCGTLRDGPLSVVLLPERKILQF